MNKKKARGNNILLVVILIVLIVAFVMILVGGCSRKSYVSSSAGASGTAVVAERQTGEAATDGAVAAGEWAATRTADAVAFDAAGLELPYFDSDEFLICCDPGRYTLMYDTMYRQASWVAYLLTREDVTVKEAARKDRFVPDPEVVRRGYPTARTSYYTNTGYDRGHLLPSADRACSQEENDATFRLSNISPQTPALNRRVWKNLEEQVRGWAERYDSLYVVTGGVLAPGLRTINNGIGVPEYFFKALLTRHGEVFHSIAFILPNGESIEGRFMDYTVTVDSLQRFTSLDFFHRLPDDIEEVVESVYDTGFWAN